MNYKTISEKLIFNELSEEERGDWFSFKRFKFIRHVDTFYYTVTTSCFDWKTESLNLIHDLLDMRTKCEETSKSVNAYPELFGDRLQMRCGFAFQMYRYHLGVPDLFDIFIADYLPNKSTPPIFVQIRSAMLWLYGVDEAVKQSIDVVKRVLAKYDIKIANVNENRIDYAFHTNYIQDPIHFFDEGNLKEMQVSDFKRWHKEGYFFCEETHCDYFTLGRRKSNNVFFRVYNKTKEVIEMGYKQFFFDIWLENGLISKFDKWLLEKCYEHGSYMYKERARCEFYAEFGKDAFVRSQCNALLENKRTTVQDFADFVKDKVPDLTIVMNVEFQVKRKFFASLKLPEVPLKRFYCGNSKTMERLNSMLFFEKSIIDMLTSDVIRFVSYKGEYQSVRRDLRPVADWWKRLRSCKDIMPYGSGKKFEILRNYQVGIDYAKIRSAMISKMASFAVYTDEYYGIERDEVDTPNMEHFRSEIYDFMGSLNDNDVQRYLQAKKEKAAELNSKKKRVINYESSD